MSSKKFPYENFKELNNYIYNQNERILKNSDYNNTAKDEIQSYNESTNIDHNRNDEKNDFNKTKPDSEKMDNNVQADEHNAQNGNEENEDNEENEPDLGNFMQMMEFVKMFSEMIKNNGSNNEISLEQFEGFNGLKNINTDSQGDNEAFDFDKQFENENIKAIKSVIPFLDPSIGKKVAVMVKLIELKYLMDTYETKVTPIENPGEYKRNILMAIRPYCNPNNQKIIDTFINVFEMGEMVNLLKSFSGN